VGGAVRDMVMGREVKDYDIEVYGLENLEQLEAVLSAFGKVNQVGKSFGVVKLKAGEREYDFSFPRTEQKNGKGHRGFIVNVNGDLSFKDAARRRDFTINAIGYDILSGEMLDPFDGLQDIQYKVLRHIEDETFVEDPLRVYRAVQFAARFGFEVEQGTAVLCKRMVAEGSLEELPKERVFEEWKKLLLKAPKPSAGFELMCKWGITQRYFPELHALIGVPQDPRWHPEGDVWVHTLLSMDAMTSMLNSEELRVKSEEWGEKKCLKLLFSVLCHDFGKPLTTTIEFENGEVVTWQEFKKNDKSVSQETHTNTLHSSLFTLHSIKRIRAIGHEKAGIEPARSFLYRLTNEHDFIESILPLVEHHLKPSQFFAQEAKAGAIRRLATKVNIEELVLVAEADYLGRGNGEQGVEKSRYPAGEWLLERASKLQVKENPLTPLIQGRDLIAMGLKPSPRFKEILEEVYQLQMDGVFESKEDAKAYIEQKLLQ
jgi:tRNA nucleotidyltransferase (CCA-adding enzyme)